MKQSMSGWGGGGGIFGKLGISGHRNLCYSAVLCFLPTALPLCVAQKPLGTVLPGQPISNVALKQYLARGALAAHVS